MIRFRNTKFTDEAIIAAVRSGQDDEVLQYLYKKSLPKIKKYICDNSGTTDEANDIFQDAVIVFYRYVMENKWKETQEIDAFLFSVARNAWISYVKQKNKKISLENTPEIDNGAADYLQTIITEERSAQVQKWLAQIGERCKEILIKRIFYEKSMPEICQEMGYLNEDAAKTAHYKCKQKLMQIIEKDLSQQPHLL